MNDELERFSVSIPGSLLTRFDEMVQRSHYPSRSEALRDVIRDYLVSAEWETNSDIVVGTVTLVYNHDQRLLSNMLTSVQHEHHSQVISTLHIHLDQSNCLEVIVLKGPTSEIRRLADQMIGSRGVKHGKLVCTTTGANLT